MVPSLYTRSCVLSGMDGLLKQRSTVFGPSKPKTPSATISQPPHRSLRPIHRNGRARRQVKLLPAYLCQFTTVAAAWELSIVTGGWQQEALPSFIWGSWSHEGTNMLATKALLFDQSADAGKRFGIFPDKNKTIGYRSFGTSSNPPRHDDCEQTEHPALH